MTDVGLTYIRGYYRVPARQGGRVEFEWPKGIVQTGVIVGSVDAHLLVDFGRGPEVLHPTWGVTYLDSDGGVSWPATTI